MLCMCVVTAYFEENISMEAFWIKFLGIIFFVFAGFMKISAQYEEKHAGRKTL